LKEQGGAGSGLEELHGLIEWPSLERQLDGIYGAAKCEPAWPPLALFKALLLAVWYDLSDVKLAEALDDRASFRRFCGFSAHESTPERTAFVRFRKELLTRGLDKTLFDEITRQLKAKAVTVKTGTLVDATIIASASEGDGEARWVKHKNHKAIHGSRLTLAQGLEQTYSARSRPHREDLRDMETQLRLTPHALEGASPTEDEPAEKDLPPCPCCGGRMIVIEVLERGAPLRRLPFSAAVTWFDTS
jgi:hypothetical protein